MSKKRGKIICATSCKGGVGKTVTLLNLAGVYGNMGLKTLVLDFDLYGGAVATYLNSTNDRTIYNLVEDLTNNRYETLDDYVFSYNDNIDIIASPKDPRFAGKIDSKYIPLILNNAVYRYDVVLIDTSSVLDEVNVVTLDNSDSILYIFSNDAFDLKNTKSFMSIIKDVNYDNVYTLLNLARDPYRTYFSMYDIRNIIKYNVDFVIDKNYHIRNVDKYIMDGKIFILNSDLNMYNRKIYEVMSNMAKRLISDKKGSDKNEKDTF